MFYFFLLYLGKKIFKLISLTTFSIHSYEIIYTNIFYKNKSVIFLSNCEHMFYIKQKSNPF